MFKKLRLWLIKMLKAVPEENFHKQRLEVFETRKQINQTQTPT